VSTCGASHHALRSSEVNCTTTVNPKTNTNLRLGKVGEDIPAILLVGGMGTRLQPVLPSTPKPLARVGDAPFLELLVRQLRSQGFRRLVMCTGHLADQIEKEFGDGRRWDVAISYSEESRPLGTAGAVKFAERYFAQAADFLVMNGDSFLELDFRRLVRFHREHGGMMSMATRRVPDATRYGTVQMDASNRVIGFGEKIAAPVPGTINGGVYVFNRSSLQHFPDGPASLEKDVIPRILQYGVYAFEQHGIFIDIGTPEDYARAQQLCDSLRQATLSE
jgi:NDP-sugar pyrophosphorylase family protein